MHDIWQMSDSEQTKVQMGEITLYFAVPQRGLTRLLHIGPIYGGAKRL